MMIPTSYCPVCGAVWQADETCESLFHQMLFWEAEHPDYGAQVHHLMVLCYYLQHPHLYSPEGLAEGKRLLVAFLQDGIAPQQIRAQNRERVDSSQRTWKIAATPKSQGAYYTYPAQWTMTPSQVVAGGVDHYCDNVRAWARSVLETLEVSGNLPA